MNTGTRSNKKIRASPFLPSYSFAIFRIVQILLVTAVLVAMLTGLTLVNHHFAAYNPGGNDFVSRWLGLRLYLTEGLSPYSDEASQAIQQFIYGRPAQPNEDQVLFVYPFYVLFLMAPVAFIGDYNLARALWMTVLEVAIILITALSLALARWRPTTYMLAALLLFSLLWYHSLRPLVNGNPSILCALFITAAFVAIRSGRDLTAGFLLSLAAIKPHVVLLLIPFVYLWAYSRRRWHLLGGLTAGHLALVVAASLLMPDWIRQNLAQVRAYPEYTLPGTPGAIFATWWPGAGHLLGWALTLMLTLLLLWSWRKAWRQDFDRFFWTACLTMAITNLIGIRTAVENYVIMLPAVILVFAGWIRQWNRHGRWFVLVAMLTLFAGLWALFLLTIQGRDAQHPILFFPLPLFLLLSLHTSRVEYYVSRVRSHVSRVTLT